MKRFKLVVRLILSLTISAAGVGGPLPALAAEPLAVSTAAVAASTVPVPSSVSIAASSTTTRSVIAAMVPVVAMAAAAPFETASPVLPASEREITLNVQGMTLKTILEAIARQTGASFIVDKEIQDRRFSAFLDKVKMRSALAGLLESHGMGYEQVNESETYVVKEMSKTRLHVVTKIFRLRYTQLAESSGAAPAAAATSAFKIIESGGDKGGAGKSSGGGSGGGSTISQVVQTLLSPNGRLDIHAQTNSLVVTDVPENMPRIAELIESLDMKVPQVLIQADIVETDASFARQLGVEIGGPNGELASLTGPARLISYPTSSNNYSFFPTAQELGGATVTPPTGGVGGNNTLGTFFGLLSFQQFTVLLRAIETNGKGKFLARPKILTLNNKSAEISLTADTVVGIQSASLIAQSGLLTTTAERQSTGVVLRVTPQVNDGGLVTLLIEPSVTRPQASQFFAQYVDAQTQSVRTSVRIKDGSTLMIGGLLSDETTTNVRKVPFLGSIPILGRLFSSENKQVSKKELMIFITPILMRD